MHQPSPPRPRPGRRGERWASLPPRLDAAGIKNITRRHLAEQAGLYPTHVSDYFSVKENKRELPARHISTVERVLGNTVISQYQAAQSELTVLEELQVMRKAA